MSGEGGVRRGLRAELKTAIKFGPGPRAVTFLAVCFVVPVAILWALGYKTSQALPQWVMTICAVGGLVVWVLRSSKFKLNLDGIGRRRLGRFEMWRWNQLSAIRREGGWWIVEGEKGEAFRFSGWTGDAPHLAELIEYAISAASSPEPGPSS